MESTVDARRRRARLRAVLACSLAGTLVAACGSSSSSSSSSSSAANATTATSAAATTAAATATSAAATTAGGAASSATPAKGDPIKVMTIGPVEAPGFSLPSLPVGAQIAIDEINAAGGINGRPLELVVCNDKNDPNEAAQCGKKAAEQKVVAVVGGLSVFDAQVAPLLKSSGVPWIGPATSSLFAQDGAYIFGGDGATVFSGIGLALAKQGCKNIAILQSATQPGDAGTKQIEAGVIVGGAKVAAKLVAPANGGDFAPTVAAARDAGADCIGAGTGPAETGPLIAAMKAGAPLKLAVAEGGLPEIVLGQLGAAADGVIAILGYLPNADPAAKNAALAQKAAAVNAKIPYDTFTRSGYVSVQLVKEALKGQTDVSAAAVVKGLTSVKGYDTGLGPVLDFSKPGSVAGYERVFDSHVFVAVAKGGKYELTDPKPVDMTPSLAQLAKK